MTIIPGRNGVSANSGSVSSDRRRRRMRVPPMTTTPMNATATASSTSTDSMVKLLAATPDATDRIMMASTSSMTAAPRMIRPDRVSQRPEVAQHVRRDADAGGGQGGGEEDGLSQVAAGELGGEESAGEGQDDAECADRQRGDADAQQLMEAGLDAHLEQEQDDADLGEERRLGVDLVDAEDGGTDDDAAQDLADDRSAGRSAEDLVPDLRRQEDREELEQDLGHVIHRRLHPVECAVGDATPAVPSRLRRQLASEAAGMIAVTASQGTDGEPRPDAAGRARRGPGSRRRGAPARPAAR